MPKNPLYFKSQELLSKGFFHPRVDFSELECTFEGIEENTSFLHITDLHLGIQGIHSWLSIPTQIELIKKIVAIIKEKKPDAILFTGDVSTKISEFPWHSALPVLLNRILKPLKDVSIPKYATYGNHDILSKDSRDILHDYGFVTVSESQEEPQIFNSNTFPIWALPDYQTQRDLHDRMCALIMKKYTSQDKKILPIILAHNPDSFDHLPKDLRFFGLAGHTHGGAYKNPTLNIFAIERLKLENKQYVSGTFGSDIGSIFFVSRGAGRHIATPFSTVPMEVTLVSIVRRT